ncbi:MAG: ATP-binding protein [Betaproteobacteria bacterium]
MLRSSLSTRYLVVSLVVAILPLAATVVLYDRYAADLVLRLAGQRVEASLAAAASKLADFLRGKSYQLEALADLPQFSRLAKAEFGALDAQAMALLRFEADSPDVYAVLLLDRADRVVAALPGRSATELELSGAPGVALAALPRVEVHGVELIGPMPPADGRPGWFLIRRALAAGGASVALQVRLASLTELLAGSSPDVYRALLHTPGGRLFSPVGVEWRGAAKLVRGPDIAPGWYPVLYPAAAALPPAGAGGARHALIGLALACGGAIVALFVLLGRRLRRRLAPLIAGAEAVARGDFALDVPARGDDEVSKLARALNHMSAQLRALIRSHVESEKRAVLGQFAASVAHEVRNPLATMKTSVQALGARERDAGRRELLELVADEIERINGVIESLLSFARPREPERAEVSARELLRRVAALAGPMAEEGRVRLTVLGEPELRLLVDVGQAQQILMNLVLNALQAMPEGGLLTLRAHRENGFGCISVSDTGHGMAKEVAAKVMEPFFTTKPAGTGLGLPVSRQLAEMNGGALELASVPGSGTTATLRLPLAQEVPA